MLELRTFQNVRFINHMKRTSDMQVLDKTEISVTIKRKTLKLV